MNSWVFMKSLVDNFSPSNKFPFLRSLVTQFLGDKVVSVHVDLKTKVYKFTQDNAECKLPYGRLFHCTELSTNCIQFISLIREKQTNKMKQLKLCKSWTTSEKRTLLKGTLLQGNVCSSNRYLMIRLSIHVAFLTVRHW